MRKLCILALLTLTGCSAQYVGYRPTLQKMDSTRNDSVYVGVGFTYVLHDDQHASASSSIDFAPLPDAPAMADAGR